MVADEIIEAVPLAKDAGGVYRVGGTRVTMDSVVHAFNRGATAEEIMQDYPALRLADIYQVIGYYLNHGAEFVDYFARREHEERELLAAHLDEWSPPGLRQRLLARQKTP